MEFLIDIYIPYVPLQIKINLLVFTQMFPKAIPESFHYESGLFVHRSFLKSHPSTINLHYNHTPTC